MFLQIAVAAIGIGIVVMIGYLVTAETRNALGTTATELNISTDLDNAQETVFSGFRLVAVGVIVLAAFGLIAVFSR